MRQNNVKNETKLYACLIQVRDCDLHIRISDAKSSYDFMNYS